MDDVRKRAIEAAATQLSTKDHPSFYQLVMAYEAAMLEAGWKMVARQPTEEMNWEGTGQSDEGVPVIWRSMWDVAPSPATDP